jgi:hypothetical protein
MWLSIIVKVVTSDMAKALIAMLIKKLLNSKTDGVTKDVAEAMLDGVAQSRANNVAVDAFDAIKQNL